MLSISPYDRPIGWRLDGISEPNNHPNANFINFVNYLLTLAKIPNDTKQQMLLEDKLLFWKNVFTAPSYNSEQNYEFYELIGDSVLNCCTIMFLCRKFPQFCTPVGIRILARLKIEYVSKQKFSAWAQKLGFDAYILCDPSEKCNGKVKRSILEDCFEAFAGALMVIMETHSAAYEYCYNFLESILEQENILLNPEKLFDAKSRLKECFDLLKNYELKYRHSIIKDSNSAKNGQFLTEIIIREPDGNYFIAGFGEEWTKKTSSQIAAKNAIYELKRRGLYTEKPDYYGLKN